ncbi:hypothetical protein B0T18DRAFT_420182 [Schizothecium vesticola]|uniref:Secreted protein n=1 Tax=Schizothecium vesticola TaxID=314040 RepID=A0AA40ELE9_9PEZI|nr:hypothetical protein B0T18DRAFT_420182 [Schizothecium vesticola]
MHVPFCQLWLLLLSYEYDPSRPAGPNFVYFGYWLSQVGSPPSFRRLGEKIDFMRLGSAAFSKSAPVLRPVQCIFRFASIAEARSESEHHRSSRGYTQVVRIGLTP